MTGLRAAGFPEAAVRERARSGAAAVFPAEEEYGRGLFGAVADRSGADALDALRLVPPVFVPERLEKLIDLGREPGHEDVALDTDIGGFSAALPLYVSAFGSTRAGSSLAIALSAQAGALGIPLVIGENVVPTDGSRSEKDGARGLIARLLAYAESSSGTSGGVAVQQSTEDADAEVWNLVYSAPEAQPLLASGRLAFELKVGQGAKPGLGGMAIVDAAAETVAAGRYRSADVLRDGRRVLRCATAGTFTEEILRQQVRFMRNNYPRARVWVKLPPGRDVGAASAIAWAAGADVVTVDGAEGGTGWAPKAALEHAGLPLAECLERIDPGESCLLVSGRMWEGARVVKALALGARAAGLGRAALLAVDEDPAAGLTRLVACLRLELQLLVSALGKYSARALRVEDVWRPGEPAAAREVGKRDDESVR
ncbi:glutamate synthase-related protein [Amycolatopsis sp. OK19-0408]|uniref:Glutamate synthase-related protein n=1 Tax=Amycolatopsis iheyensis TaxID=2945988 RepID=A0A9X2NEA5_9PSEU|nr:glutamate synthase-related protein [Amycolatopsis iheyensis]MCR6485763.1 glutamate synthase-related protein [Amycolatopsis iheyensis]